MGRIYIQNNGKTTVLFNAEDINTITPSADTYFVGTDLATGYYEKLNPDGSIIDLEGGGSGGTTSYIIVTKSELDTLISTSGLTEGAFYKKIGRAHV